ncbi:terminase large subunit domain-containing protein, partial [Streptomyces sp. PKU-EA00015]|uniref:terminase large subunit domain-containing protein n=1 Tax=Streptomyces sp. PKU-EA00015 TaxID=2748326 RepID=UPI0028127A43
MTADLDARLAAMSPAELELLEAELRARLWQKRWNKWTPYPWQVPPAEIPTMGWWLQLGGRGTGKTDGCARYMVQHVNGPPCDERMRGGHRMAIVAPTQGDAVEACVNGPSGLKAHDPRVVLRTTTGGTFVKWPSGAEAKLFGAHSPDDIERLRAGGNRCLVWMEEVAAQRRLKEAITHSEMGLRLGRNPHYIGSTTPKPRTEVIELKAHTDVIVTHGRTRDATHLPQEQRDFLVAKYAGTRLEAQELDGILMEDIEGALWSRAGLDTTRVGAAPPMARIVVAMDPAATSSYRRNGVRGVTEWGGHQSVGRPPRVRRRERRVGVPVWERGRCRGIGGSGRWTKSVAAVRACRASSVVVAGWFVPGPACGSLVRSSPADPSGWPSPGRSCGCRRLRLCRRATTPP